MYSPIRVSSTSRAARRALTLVAVREMKPRAAVQSWSGKHGESLESLANADDSQHLREALLYLREPTEAAERRKESCKETLLNMYDNGVLKVASAANHCLYIGRRIQQGMAELVNSLYIPPDTVGTTGKLLPPPPLSPFLFCFLKTHNTR